MKQLHDSNTSFNQPPGQQQLAAMQSAAISLQHMFRFLRDVEGIRRLDLHAVCQLKRLDPGFQLWFFGVRSLMLTILPLQEIELPPLVAA